ncbi:hypothetical protein GoPhGRU1p49 [Gordonia phage GRU1]|uniref:Uncharacterized protein n=1 Tax=Gordonia phage GRU1 TaxID=1109710 RepID=G8EK08_9CAUD|nr:hypothetical protein GoPhGRU1p49 [Gordonia phage GRU1]AET09890.1 hypothetical protein [Gordonia phage GRU1]
MCVQGDPLHRRPSLFSRISAFSRATRERWDDGRVRARRNSSSRSLAWRFSLSVNRFHWGSARARIHQWRSGCPSFNRQTRVPPVTECSLTTGHGKCGFKIGTRFTMVMGSSESCSKIRWNG